MAFRFEPNEVISFRGWAVVLRGLAESPFKKGVWEREIISFLHFCKTRHSPVTIEFIRFYLQEIGAQEVSSSRLALLWFVANAPKGTVGALFSPQSKVKGEGEGGVGGKIPKVAGVDVQGGENSPHSKTDSDARPAVGPTAETAGGAGAVEPRPYDQARVRRSATPKPARSDMGGPEWEKRLIAACRQRGFQWRTEETYRMWAVRFADFIKPGSPETAGYEAVSVFLEYPNGVGLARA